jgi:hypothetical protein
MMQPGSQTPFYNNFLISIIEDKGDLTSLSIEDKEDLIFGTSIYIL